MTVLFYTGANFMNELFNARFAGPRIVIVDSNVRDLALRSGIPDTGCASRSASRVGRVLRRKGGWLG